MTWPHDKRRGALLAATIAGDGQLARAEAGLSKGTAEAALAAGAELGGTDRQGALRELARSIKPTPRAEAVESARARALVAARMPTATGERWLTEAPPIRRGYRAPRGVVEAIARARVIEDRSTADRDRGEGRELLARATEEERRRLLEGASAEEAAAVLALAAHPGQGRPPSRALLAAASIAPGARRVEVLGALGRGARLRGDHVDSEPAARAGRELAELGLVETP